MPEQQRCVYCDKAIDEDKEKWVIIDSVPEKFGDPIVPRLAHADCHNALAGTALPSLK
jgi:hypothetical protein